jgi:hypothetical protein
MEGERRDPVSRAETLRRVTLWISQVSQPAIHVPSYVVIAEAGQRILKRLALRGFVRRVSEGWIPLPPLLNPFPVYELSV